MIISNLKVPSSKHMPQNFTQTKWNALTRLTWFVNSSLSSSASSSSRTSSMASDIISVYEDKQHKHWCQICKLIFHVVVQRNFTILPSCPSALIASGTLALPLPDLLGTFATTQYIIMDVSGDKDNTNWLWFHVSPYDRENHYVFDN